MLKIEKGGKKGANFPRTVYLPFLFSSYLIAVLYALNSKALIDTSAIYYKDSEYNALGGIDACVKDAVTKNRFPKNGTFLKILQPVRDILPLDIDMRMVHTD